MTHATVRPGNVLAALLAKAEGKPVTIGAMNRKLISVGKVNATDKTGAYLGDIKRYDDGIVVREYDANGHLASASLANWKAFNSDGMNVKSAWRNARKGRGGLSDISVTEIVIPATLMLTDDTAANDALLRAALSQ